MDQLQTDPERFQYKLGAGQGGQTGSLSGAPAFNQDLAGVVHAWTDPADGLHYVVNGHNRHALAVRSGQAGLDTRFLDAPTAEEARTQGALINIAEGQGTAIDAAKLFRDQSISPEELAAQGIAVKGEKARQGMALANLAPPLFGQVVRGELPVERAALIGEKLPEAGGPDGARATRSTGRRSRGGRSQTARSGELADAVRPGRRSLKRIPACSGTRRPQKARPSSAPKWPTICATQLGSEGARVQRSGQERGPASKEETTSLTPKRPRGSRRERPGEGTLRPAEERAGPVSDILNRAAVRLAKSFRRKPQCR